jgi:hypothetical protein
LLVNPQVSSSEADDRSDKSVPPGLNTLEELFLRSKITKLIAIASSLAALIVAGSASIKIG